MAPAAEDATAGELDLLLIGPATRDLLPGGGWRLGGTVLYGALAAARFGLRVGVLTYAPSDVADALRAALPNIRIVARSSQQAATFENVYDATGARCQYLRQRGEPLQAEDVPSGWLGCERIWLAPLACDVDPGVVAAFPAKARVAATPQGWLRQWDVRGRVSPGLWSVAASTLGRIEALILSEEDLQGPGSSHIHVPDRPAGWLARDPQLTTWRESGPLVVVTQGDRGATLQTRSTEEQFPAFPVAATDPTGAGDVFAGALLSTLWTGRDVREAMRLANAAASLLVERGGTAGIPTLDEARARASGSPDSSQTRRR
jgi:sugar/nucleoside kinase (ribokinase family)